MLKRVAVTIPTAHRTDFIDLTPLLEDAVAKSGVHEGIAHVLVRHTSCSLHNPYHALAIARLVPAVRAKGWATLHYQASDAMDVYRFLTLGLYLVSSPLLPNW